MTQKIAWLTDIHLDFLSLSQTVQFWSGVAAQKPDALLIGGDISHAMRLLIDLRILQEYAIPFYFVLGNHDFYRGSITELYDHMADFNQQASLGVCLEKAGVIELSPETGLVGHGGWGDAHYGDVAHMLELNDDVYIYELERLTFERRIRKLNQLGEEAARHLEPLLITALEKYPQVYVLTHVPPFKEAARYDGDGSVSRGLPRFTCKAVGDMLIRVVSQYPEKQVTVLAGHTHYAVVAQILPNLQIQVGAAEYNKPTIQAMFTV